MTSCSSQLDISAALDRWRAAIGAENVTCDSETLRAAETATFATSQRVPAILRPADRAEVQECLRIAAAHGVPVYPVSRGRNWGLGSRVPARGECVLLELSRMDRIRGFDEELAHVTVEPGVTFRQLYEFLVRRRSRLYLNTIGGSPEASVLANALERGDGSGPYADRFAHVCALEVVLSTGECLHTGFGRFGGPLAPLHRWGVGPALDGLFSQSNLGVVTELTVWLTPLPRSLHAVRFSLRGSERLARTVDVLRGLRLEGTVRAPVGLWNHRRVHSVSQQSSVSASDEGRWFGLTALYAASPELGAALRRELERGLGPEVDDLSIEARSGEPRSGLELFSDDDPALLFLQGIPHEGSLRSMYWKKGALVPPRPAPEADRCGVIWLCPAVPFGGQHVVSAVELAEQVLSARGFEPLLALVGASERCVYLLPAIVYDRDVPGCDARAMACHDELLDRFCRLGYLPHRLGIQSMDSLPDARDDSAAALRRIKAALDPAGVLAPGRYDGA